jgi:hypothetical protein
MLSTWQTIQRPSSAPQLGTSIIDPDSYRDQTSNDSLTFAPYDNRKIE